MLNESICGGGGWTLAIKSRGDSVSANGIRVALLLSYTLLVRQTRHCAVHLIQKKKVNI